MKDKKFNVIIIDNEEGKQIVNEHTDVVLGALLNENDSNVATFDYCVTAAVKYGAIVNTLLKHMLEEAENKDNEILRDIVRFAIMEALESHKFNLNKETETND